MMAPEAGPRWRQLRIGQYWLASREPLQMAIGLNTGGYAVLESRGDIAPRILAEFRPASPSVRSARSSAWRRSSPSARGPTAARAGRCARPLHAERSAGARSPRGAPEIKQLIAAVNDMQGRIAALVKGRTMLLGAISHDLKTYITRLRLRAESSRIPGSTRAVRDLDDMAALIEDALGVARGAAVSDRRERSISATCFASWSPTARIFACATDRGSLEDWAMRVALRRIFANLIDNALRYGTAAEVTARAGRRRACASSSTTMGLAFRR